MLILKPVLLRDGESVWNLENRFTGWTDVDLSDQEIREAHRAGQLLKAEGYFFDLAFASVLKRAIRTSWIVLDGTDLMWIRQYARYQCIRLQAPYVGHRHNKSGGP